MSDKDDTEDLDGDSEIASASARFPTISDEEEENLLNNVDTKNTKKSTLTAVKVFREYLTAKNQPVDFETYSKEQLDDTLAKFYLELRSKNGQLYKKSTFHTYRHGLQRHLQKAREDIDIFKGNEFKKSAKAFKSMTKELKRQGKAAVSHYPQIADEDFETLYNYFACNLHDLQTLQYKVFVDITLYFGRMGREKITSLTREDFCVVTEDEGETMYVYKVQDNESKQDERDDRRLSVDGKMYEIKGSSLCPVRSFVRYIRMLHPKCRKLFQQVRPTAKEGNQFYNCPVGHNKIGSFMTEISKVAGLSRIYTNHSLRPTTFNLLDVAYIPRPTMHIVTVTDQRELSELQTLYAEAEAVNSTDHGSMLMSAAGTSSGTKSMILGFTDNAKEFPVKIVEVNEAKKRKYDDFTLNVPNDRGMDAETFNSTNNSETDANIFHSTNRTEDICISQKNPVSNDFEAHKETEQMEMVEQNNSPAMHVIQSPRLENRQCATQVNRVLEKPNQDKCSHSVNSKPANRVSSFSTTHSGSTRTEHCEDSVGLNQSISSVNTAQKQPLKISLMVSRVVQDSDTGALKLSPYKNIYPIDVNVSSDGTALCDVSRKRKTENDANIDWNEDLELVLMPKSFLNNNGVNTKFKSVHEIKIEPQDPEDISFGFPSVSTGDEGSYQSNFQPESNNLNFQPESNNLNFQSESNNSNFQPESNNSNFQSESQTSLPVVSSDQSITNPSVNSNEFSFSNCSEGSYESNIKTESDPVPMNVMSLMTSNKSSNNLLVNSHIISDSCVAEKSNQELAIETSCAEPKLFKELYTEKDSEWIYANGSWKIETTDNKDIIRFSQITSEERLIQRQLLLFRDLSYKIKVHGQLLKPTHSIYGVAEVLDSVTAIRNLLSRVGSFSVCSGVRDNNSYVYFIMHKEDPTHPAFREGNFGGKAFDGSKYDWTVRTHACDLLIKSSLDKCMNCQIYAEMAKLKPIKPAQL